VSKHLHTWRKACAVQGIRFTPEQIKAGWPESIDLGRIARLQSPDNLTNERIIYAGLLDACASGELPAQKGERTVTTGYKKEFLGIGRNGEVFRHTPVQATRDIYMVQAPAFMAWLDTLGEEPSPHISAWFDALGLTAGAAAPVASITPMPPKKKRRDLLTPLIETVQKEQANPFDTAAIWLRLCELATAKTYPLIGITGDSIQWRIDSLDEPKEFTRKMLSDRLRKQKLLQPKATKTQLKRVK